MIEIFLSTDGKMTVKIEADETVKDQVVERYKIAKRIYDQILVDYPGTKHGVAMEKIKEEDKLGTCPDCGAKMLLSKAGKPYCSDRCWLK